MSTSPQLPSANLDLRSNPNKSKLKIALVILGTIVSIAAALVVIKLVYSAVAETIPKTLSSKQQANEKQVFTSSGGKFSLSIPKSYVIEEIQLPYEEVTSINLKIKTSATAKQGATIRAQLNKSGPTNLDEYNEQLQQSQANNPNLPLAQKTTTLINNEKAWMQKINDHKEESYFLIKDRIGYTIVFASLEESVELRDQILSGFAIN